MKVSDWILKTEKECVDNQQYARVVLESFALQELVQDVIHKYELEARQHGVQLTQHLEKDPPYVYGDIGLIERVLDNLLDNALRHTPRSGMVTGVHTHRMKIPFRWR